MSTPEPAPSNAAAAEARAKGRYAVMNIARIGGLAMVIFGIAIARGIVPLPYALGVVLAVLGLFEFFFLPTLLARRWKAAERKGEDQGAP